MQNKPSSLRRPKIAFSGRIDGSTLSHLGPPTAPSNTASAFLQASIVSSVNGTPYASIDSPPAFLSIQLTFTLAFSKATSHTAFAAVIISVPIPSPGINTIFFPLILPLQYIVKDCKPHALPQCPLRRNRNRT